VEIDAAQCPDIIPVLALAAALRPGLVTGIIRAGRLRLKESDRLRATAQILGALGAEVEEKEDGLLIRGTAALRGGARIRSGDHRMVMTAAIAATICAESVTLEDPACVYKSYPRFYEDFRALGGRQTSGLPETGGGL
jgi:3-phosphoshikimate 1-carboxyvinyltransferase